LTDKVGKVLRAILSGEYAVSGLGICHAERNLVHIPQKLKTFVIRI
jgi:hypothetical protein